MWNHDADPTVGLQVNEIISRFKKEMAANPQYLQEYVKKYFIVSRACNLVISSWLIFIFK